MLQSQSSEADRKVFVGGLPSFSTERSLYSYFSQFGEIEQVNIVIDKHTNRSKGYGFVLFKDAVSAYASVTNPYPFIDGKSCNCNLASLGAKPQSSQKKGGKRSHPGDLDDSQNKRMKTERKSKHSYIQQLQQELNVEITKDYVLSNIEKMKATSPAPDVFKYLLEMMDVFEDSQEEYTKLYNELLEASKAYRRKQIENDKKQKQTDQQQMDGSTINNGKEEIKQNVDNQIPVTGEGEQSDQMTQDKEQPGQSDENISEEKNVQSEQQVDDQKNVKAENQTEEQEIKTEDKEMQTEEQESKTEEEEEEENKTEEQVNQIKEQENQSEQQENKNEEQMNQTDDSVIQTEEQTSQQNEQVNVQNEENKNEKLEDKELSESNKQNEPVNEEEEEEYDDEGSSYHEE